MDTKILKASASVRNNVNQIVLGDKIVFKGMKFEIKLPENFESGTLEVIMEDDKFIGLFQEQRKKRQF